MIHIRDIVCEDDLGKYVRQAAKVVRRLDEFKNDDRETFRNNIESAVGYIMASELQPAYGYKQVPHIYAGKQLRYSNDNVYGCCGATPDGANVIYLNTSKYRLLENPVYYGLVLLHELCHYTLLEQGIDCGHGTPFVKLGHAIEQEFGLNEDSIACATSNFGLLIERPSLHTSRWVIQFRHKKEKMLHRDGLALAANVATPRRKDAVLWLMSHGYECHLYRSRRYVNIGEFYVADNRPMSCCVMRASNRMGV